MSNHEDWVTSRMRAWLKLDAHNVFVQERLAEIKRLNEEAGNHHPDDLDDDCEYLADKLEDYFVRNMIDPMHTGIIQDYAADAASEVNWLEIAEGYLECDTE